MPTTWNTQKLYLMLLSTHLVMRVTNTGRKRMTQRRIIHRSVLAEAGGVKSLMAMLDKTYECLNPDCKAKIKLEKRPDGGWNKFNLDNTPHVHPKGGSQQQQQQASRSSDSPTQQQQNNNQQTLPPRNEIADLRDELNEVRALIKTAITQIQLARREIEELGK